MSAPAVFTLPGLEHAVKGHVALWISDYLGVQELKQGIPLGYSRRPNAGSYKRIEEFPPKTVEVTPCVYIASNGFDEDSIKRQPSKGYATAQGRIDVAVATAVPAGKTEYEAGRLPRLYMHALLDLFMQQATIADGVTVPTPARAVVAGEPTRSDGSNFAYAVVSLDVTAPLVLTERLFDSPPSGPHLPPRDPDIPVVAESILINVEAL